jgi:hypothetical protein
MLARRGLSSRPRSACTLLLRGLPPLPHGSPADGRRSLGPERTSSPGRVCAAFSAWLGPWAAIRSAENVSCGLLTARKDLQRRYGSRHRLPIACRQEKEGQKMLSPAEAAAMGLAVLGSLAAVVGIICLMEPRPRNALYCWGSAWPPSGGRARSWSCRSSCCGPWRPPGSAGEDPGHCPGADGPMYCCAAAWTCMMN